MLFQRSSLPRLAVIVLTRPCLRLSWLMFSKCCITQPLLGLVILETATISVHTARLAFFFDLEEGFAATSQRCSGSLKLFQDDAVLLEDEI